MDVGCFSDNNSRTSNRKTMHTCNERKKHVNRNNIYFFQYTLESNFFIFHQTSWPHKIPPPPMITMDSFKKWVKSKLALKWNCKNIHLRVFYRLSLIASFRISFHFPVEEDQIYFVSCITIIFISSHQFDFCILPIFMICIEKSSCSLFEMKCDIFLYYSCIFVTIIVYERNFFIHCK